MQHDAFVCEVRCPVHGFIGLTALERQIIDTPAFQRLRRIKQLAWTDYVYPGASHTRFEHSLGVMHIAGRLFESITTNSAEVLREVFGYSDGGLARDWQIVRLAGLLHDIGHAPFSHATEHLLPMKVVSNPSMVPGAEEEAKQYEHEDYSVAVIELLLRDLIEQHPANRRNTKIAASEVTALIAKRTPGGNSLFWKDIISGQLDADRMDYLLRDSLHAGVSYGHFDLNRIVTSVCAIKRPSEETDEPKVAIMRGGAYAAEALIVARYWMHKQVYFHKTRLACNFHLENAVREILTAENEGNPKLAFYPRPDSVEQLNAFLAWDDYRVMGLLASGAGGEHGRRLMTRDHYRLVCELQESGTTINEIASAAAKNRALIKSLGSFVTHATLPNTSWYKGKANDLLLVDDGSQKQIGLFSEFSSLMKSINVGASRFVYADKSKAAEARDLYAELVRQDGSQRNTQPGPNPPNGVDASLSLGGSQDNLPNQVPLATDPQSSQEGQPIEAESIPAQLALVPSNAPKGVKSEKPELKGVQNVG